MAGSVNKVILVGSLGADPEVRSFQNGGRICNLRIATSENWTDKQSGEKRERTEWHSVTINGDGLIGVAERYLRKGSKVYLEGKLQTRKWQDQAGNDRYTTEVVVAGIGGALPEAANAHAMTEFARWATDHLWGEDFCSPAILERLGRAPQPFNAPDKGEG